MPDLIDESLAHMLLSQPRQMRRGLKRPRQASAMRGWFDVPGIMMQYSRSTGHRKRTSILVGWRMPRSQFVFIRLSIPWSTIDIPDLRINVQRIVPEDSGIFTACKRGDVIGVKDLLESRAGSLHDITTENETLLTVSLSKCPYRFNTITHL